MIWLHIVTPFLQIPSKLFQRSGEDEAKRRKAGEAAGEEAVYHPIKLSRSDLYRPPTAEELSQLKEAESLFHCSLLKMQVRCLTCTSPCKPVSAPAFMHASQMSLIWQQMEELLKEVVLSERRKRQIDAFVRTVTTLLQAVPRSSEVEVCVWRRWVWTQMCHWII